MNPLFPTFIVLFLVFCTFNTGFAQDTLAANHGQLNVRIFSINGHISRGYLYEMTDTSLLLSSEKHLPRWYDSTAHSSARSFGYREMNHINFYKKGRVGRSTLIGLAIGTGVGLLAGFASGDDDPNKWFAFTAAEKAVALGIFCGSVGTFIGFISGLSKNKGFIIRGKKENYDRMRKKMAARLGI